MFCTVTVESLNETSASALLDSFSRIVERIAVLVQLVQKGVHLRGEPLFIEVVDAPEVAQHVVFGPEREHFTSTRRLPAVDGGRFERYERAVGVFTHPRVFDTDFGSEVCDAPGDPVDVVLHQGLDRNALFVHQAQFAKAVAQGRVVAHFAHVEEHAGDFDVALLDPILEPRHLFGRTGTDEVEHRAGGLAGPAELRVGRIVLRLLAVVERMVDVFDIMRDDFRLRTRKANVRMRMLHEIHRVRTHRLHAESTYRADSQQNQLSLVHSNLLINV